MVYVLFHMPYGCPAHDVQILGVFKTEDGAFKAKAEYVKSEAFEARELIIEDKELED